MQVQERQHAHSASATGLMVEDTRKEEFVG